MADPPAILPIHSLAEAYLYLMVTPCPACGSGSMTADEARVQHDASQQVLTLPVTCKKCNQPQDIAFDTRRVEPGGFAPVPPKAVATVNPTDEPSQVIDVAGWVTLFAVIAESVNKGESPAEARFLKMEAAQCLDEALKFYEPDNDLPPAEAFFSERSQAQFRRQPEVFSFGRLIGLRAKLPTPQTAAHPRPVEKKPSRPKRRWWPWSRQ